MKKNMLIPESRARNAYELLGEIRDLILEEPRRYNQYRWLIIDDPKYVFQKTLKSVSRLPECGTVGCVAGWTTLLKGETQKLDISNSFDILYEIARQAKRILGLNTIQAYQLFAPAAAGGNDDPVAHAERGAAHIQKFMDNYETQLKAKLV